MEGIQFGIYWTYIDGAKWYRANDLATALGASKSTVRNHLVKCHNRKLVLCKTSNGNRCMAFVDKKSLINIIVRSKKSGAIELATKFGINIHNEKIIHQEAKTVQAIKTAFKGEEMKEQFTVCNYQIDLYFVHHKIAVECDENNHNHYNTNKEMKRQKIIEKELKCSFIRYNPDDTNFNIFHTINQIYQKIIAEY